MASTILTLSGAFAQGSTLISQTGEGCRGKQAVMIYASSGCVNDMESPYMLLDGNNDTKWCQESGEGDKKSNEPWVIFSLADYYKLDKFVMTDVQGGTNEGDKRDYKNVGAYNIYISTTGTADNDWQLIYEETDGGDIAVKEAVLDTPVEAAYVKLVIKDFGMRTDGSRPSNAIRIYGFDIYGTYSRAIDRGGIISTGKTLVDFYDCWAEGNRRETPANLIDGNSDTQWAVILDKFYEDVPEGSVTPMKYVLLDLENEYDITQFILRESAPFQSKGYRVYGCTTLPEQTDTLKGRVTYLDWWTNHEKYGWKKLAEKVDYEAGEDFAVKEIALEEAVKARYLFLEPVRREGGEDFFRALSFDVYGTMADPVSIQNVEDATTLSVYPTVVKQGEIVTIHVDGKATVYAYSLQGEWVGAQAGEGIVSVSTSGLGTGLYLLKVKTDAGMRTAKIIIK